VIVIDTKMDDAAVALDDQVKKLAGNKPILVVNTHFHPDHIGGNKFYKGNTIYAGADYTKEDWIKEAGEESLPDSWLKNKLDIKMGNDTVSIFNLAKNVHTQSDIVVYLHNRKLLFAGDIVLNKQAPIIMGKGNPYGYLWAFDWFINTLDINTVVPGHGEIGGKELITNYKAYFEDMKTASFDESQKESLSSKYENWGQLPLVMSPAATIKAFKKNEIN
jgi:cyclase